MLSMKLTKTPQNSQEASPFSRENRSLVYQRAKGDIDTIPFGTRRDVYQSGYEWANHSMYPKGHVEIPRITVGSVPGIQYSAALFNISAMSFGSLSANAILALNTAAKKGNFYHNTGEGGVSPYHLANGGDICWNIGTGYFSCRTKGGDFDAEKFKEVAAKPSIKMIEIKLSQGAKPGE